ncbi:hypothetical protein FA15DRAFT_74150 [Coprinopsis marcescibilis]|uniref:Uncharacterized protein n=1 Tax=Coprinopsis marcescibilis TaxID=230819 RepID=A0A5C3L5B7_COPMA|nr:hypothetical protein FA15DRAFT_74150 [Coprinopsis marcescibilis]
MAILVVLVPCLNLCLVLERFDRLSCSRNLRICIGCFRVVVWQLNIGVLLFFAGLALGRFLGLLVRYIGLDGQGNRYIHGTITYIHHITIRYRH